MFRSVDKMVAWAERERFTKYDFNEKGKLVSRKKMFFKS